MTIADRHGIAGAPALIESELERVAHAGERLAAAESWTRWAAEFSAFVFLAGTSACAFANFSGRVAVRAEADFGGLVLATLAVFLASRMIFLFGRLFGLGLSTLAQRTVSALEQGPAPLDADLANEIKKAVAKFSAESGHPTGEILTFGALLALIVGSGTLLDARGWIALDVSARTVPQYLTYGLAGAVALYLLLVGRLDRLLKESEFRKKIAGSLFGALDDVAFDMGARTRPEKTATLDDRRHRASRYARLAVSDLRRRFGD